MLKGRLLPIILRLILVPCCNRQRKEAPLRTGKINGVLPSRGAILYRPEYFSPAIVKYVKLCELQRDVQSPYNNLAVKLPPQPSTAVIVILNLERTEPGKRGC